MTVNIIATSTKNNISGDAKAIGTGNPYGPPNAPNVNGGTSAKGDGQVHWTWNNPLTNGRPLDHYEVSVRRRRLENVGKANSFDAAGGGWSNTRTLEVRAVTVVAGPAGSANATSGADPTPPPPASQIQVDASSVRTCPGKPGQSRTATLPARPPVAASAGWSGPGASSSIDCTKDIYGNGTPWYQADRAARTGWYVKSTTVDLYGPRPGGC